ncbi:HD-GYP domain-containing protein [Caldimonas thermodepolymerans]|uniref:HD-GYP domain-containing protein n=1 Tax=Caldimonas thermodepolymerans TaxID=215580 RepID=UPI00248F88C0|nr:HD-GYP domain-containing protein [Caldimonas thermodepolymerans]
MSLSAPSPTRKKVRVEQLRPGMFVLELCGAWLDHPFWRTSFLLKDQADLERLRQSPVREVWIDIARGLDVAPEAPAAARADAVPPPPVVPVRTATPEKVPLEAEIGRARTICVRARQEVGGLFQQARMGQALRTAPVVELVEDITDSVLRCPSALVSLARLKTKDEYTYLHSVSVCALMVSLGRQLGLPGPQLREAGLAGLLHDLGKAAIPLEILNKPGRLTDEEFALVKEHPRAGHAMLSDAGVTSESALDVCLHHHERIDGRGYPDGLAGEAISLHARMGAVCDVYDAITSDRPYKAGWHPAEAIRRMAQWTKEGHFDERVFQAFVKCIGIYPTGSLVKLQSGRLAVVLEQRESSLLTPRVKVFFSTRSNLHIPPEVVDLASPLVRDRIVSHENPEDWGFRHLDELWAGLPARPA